MVRLSVQPFLRGFVILNLVFAGTALHLWALAPAATYTVTKNADTNDGACSVSDCSLREAIIAANAAPGPDTILLPSATYSLTITGADEENAATGDLDIRDSVTLTVVGPAPAVIDGNLIDRAI